MSRFSPLQGRTLGILISVNLSNRAHSHADSGLLNKIIQIGTMTSLKRIVRESLFFVLASHLILVLDPAIVFARNGNFDPINFTQPLKVTRGVVTPVSDGGVLLDDKQACDFVQEYWGWTQEQCANTDVLIFYPTTHIDTVIFDKPTNLGRVSLNDWQGNMSKEISEIESNLTQSLVSQSKKLGKNISFDGWAFYPKVDKTRKNLSYAVQTDWDGDPIINVNVALFDRFGLTKVSVVPIETIITEEILNQIIDEVIQMYKPDTGAAYHEWVTGDKVATIGAVGVLASLVGVKYGKTLWAIISGIVILVLKKAGFLLFLPLLAVGKIWASLKKIF